MNSDMSCVYMYWMDSLGRDKLRMCSIPQHRLLENLGCVWGTIDRYKIKTKTSKSDLCALLVEWTEPFTCYFFVRGNVNIQSHFRSFLHIGMAQVRQELTYFTQSISWDHECWCSDNEPGHQQPRSQGINNHGIDYVLIRSSHVEG